MSTTAAETSGQMNVRETLIPLLREYTESLNARIAEVQQTANRMHEFGSNEQYEFASALLRAAMKRCSRMEDAVGNLARRASQLLEHGRFDREDDRVELELRLADLESTLIAASEMTLETLVFATNAAQQK